LQKDDPSKPKTHFDLAGALAEGFLGGAFAGAAGLRGAALPAGRLLIDLIRRDVNLTMEFTDSVAPGPNDHGRRCRRNPEICARRRAFLSPDEVVNGVEADQSHDDQIDRHDEAQQPRHDQDQDAREEGDERRDVGNVVRVTRSIRMKFSIHTGVTHQFWLQSLPSHPHRSRPRQIDQRTWVAAAASSSES
jgi:predicted lipid-binding transport protein (Tim44 family)